MELAASDYQRLFGARGARVGGRAIAGASSEPIDVGELATLPNAITLGGYAATITWLAGGSPWFAVAGLIADELDGDVARRIDQTSTLGSMLDWAVDVALTAAVLVKLGGAWLLLAPATILAQTYLRLRGYAPPFGSARAGFTAIALW